MGVSTRIPEVPAAQRLPLAGAPGAPANRPEGRILSWEGGTPQTQKGGTPQNQKPEAPPLPEPQIQPIRRRVDIRLELPPPWMLDFEGEKPPKGKWTTAPFDPRFPNQNQTRNCYQNFLDYHRCIKNMNRRGKSTKPCEYYFRVYHSLCPISWVQRWNEQIKQGTFAGKI